MPVSAARASAPELSVVIPVLNEQDNIAELLTRLVAVLDKTAESFEIIVVDDGSRDLTRKRLRELCENERRLRVLRLARSYGQEAAVQAGVLRSRGRWVVQMDGDLQHPPEELVKLLASRTQDAEVIYGVRSGRRDPLHRVLASRAMLAIMRRGFGIELPEDVSTFRVIDGKLARFIAELPEKRKFWSALASWSGARSVCVPIEHRARGHGKSKYDIAKLFNHAFDLVVGFSVRPLRAIGVGGALLAVAGIGFGLFRIAQKLLGVDITMGYTSVFSAIVILGGLQLIALSVIGEYIARIFLQLQDRPIYRVVEEIGFEQGSAPLRSFSRFASAAEH
jgi:polyisoprenyl-phosphate glycosyltransferase